MADDCHIRCIGAIRRLIGYSHLKLVPHDVAFVNPARSYGAPQPHWSFSGAVISPRREIGTYSGHRRAYSNGERSSAHAARVQPPARTKVRLPTAPSKILSKLMFEGALALLYLSRILLEIYELHAFFGLQ